MDTLVSVIIPVYNVEPYLRTCIDSVLNQTLRQIEVIIVDDCSPDGSPAICDEYARKDKRVKVIHKKNEGLGYARNTGIEVATGEYITFLDSDDYISDDTLDLLYIYAKNNNLDIVRGTLNRFYEEGKFSHSIYDSKLRIYEGKDILKKIALCYFSQPNGSSDDDLHLEGSSCGALYHRNLFNQHGVRFLSEREFISEDFIFNYECARIANRIGKIKNTLYHYRINPTSLTKMPRKDCLSRAIDFSLYLEKMFKKDGYDSDSALYAIGYTVDTMRAHIKNIILSSLPRREIREWLKEQSKNPYFERIAQEYPLASMSFMKRLFFNSFYKKRFLLLELMIRGRCFLSLFNPPQK